MSHSTLRTRVSLLPSGSQTRSQRIADLVATLNEKTDLHPIYQRAIRWSKEKMDGLLQTIMENGIIPSLILYKLQPGDEKTSASHRWECIDGQHRLFVLFHFLTGLAVNLDGREWMISWNFEGEDKKVTHVFFAETEHTKRWIAAHPSARFDYMTEDERDFFSDFMMEIKEIKDPLTIEQRCSIFTSLQQGVQVRGSDLLKNSHPIRLIKFIQFERKWEHPFKEALRDRCYMNPKNFWLHWVVRCFLMLNPTIANDVYDNFKLRDSYIGSLIKKNDPRLTSTKEQEEVFVEAFERFLAFLKSLPSGVRFSPSQFFALFFHLTCQDGSRESILASHMPSWGQELPSKNHKVAWEKRKIGDDDEERECLFIEAVQDLERIKVAVEEMPPRKTIPKPVRNQVWISFFKTFDAEGSCYCCGEELSYESIWEAGHIIASKEGGKDVKDNLRPVCRCCNRSMGTMNMDKFKALYFSHD